MRLRQWLVCRVTRAGCQRKPAVRVGSLITLWGAWGGCAGGARQEHHFGGGEVRGKGQRGLSTHCGGVSRLQSRPVLRTTGYNPGDLSGQNAPCVLNALSSGGIFTASLTKEGSRAVWLSFSFSRTTFPTGSAAHRWLTPEKKLASQRIRASPCLRGIPPDIQVPLGKGSWG